MSINTYLQCRNKNIGTGLRNLLSVEPYQRTLQKRPDSSNHQIAWEPLSVLKDTRRVRKGWALYENTLISRQNDTLWSLLSQLGLRHAYSVAFTAWKSESWGKALNMSHVWELHSLGSTVSLRVNKRFVWCRECSCKKQAILEGATQR